MFTSGILSRAGERVEEIRLAVIRQRASVAQASDPLLASIAARTLSTLEETLLIAEKTEDLLKSTNARLSRATGRQANFS